MNQFESRFVILLFKRFRSADDVLIILCLCWLCGGFFLQ